MGAREALTLPGDPFPTLGDPPRVFPDYGLPHNEGSSPIAVPASGGKSCRSSSFRLRYPVICCIPCCMVYPNSASAPTFRDSSTMK